MMKKILFGALMLVCAASLTYGQTDQDKVMYGDVNENCTWEEVSIIDSLMPAEGVIYRIVGSMAFKKVEGKLQLSDFSPKEIETIKKSAIKVHSCTILFENNYQTPASVINVDPAKEAQAKENIYFYFMKPTKKIE